MGKIRITAPFHPAAHTPESHTGTNITAAELELLSNGTSNVTIHTHNQNPVGTAKAAMEAETSTSQYVSPDLVRHSPGTSKGWCRFTSAGALESPSFNVASITDTGTGDRTIVWDDDFSTDIFAVAISVDAPVSVNQCNQNEVTDYAVGSVRVRHYTGLGFNIATDMQGSLVAFGDQ